jgi:hypothetical protein
MQNYQAQQAARNVLVQGLQAANANLIPGNGCVIAAKNIRTELKAAFPSVKFRVTSDKYAGGDAVRVSYVDGPTSDAVEQIAEKYEAGKFDGMDDCYTYDNANLWIDAFGSAKYVTVNREFSDASVAAAIVKVESEYEVSGLTVEQYRNGDLFCANVNGSNYSLQSLIYQAMRVKGE